MIITMRDSVSSNRLNEVDTIQYIILSYSGRSVLLMMSCLHFVNGRKKEYAYCHFMIFFFVERDETRSTRI